MIRIEVEHIKNWKLAKKTKNIKAKPLISIMVDKSVTSKFLVDTLEGREPLGDGVVICVGEAGDAWQQMPSKVFAKYDAVSIDNDGWMHFQPKLNNATDCIELTMEVIEWLGYSPLEPKFYIIGQYGEKAKDGLRQYCQEGDFIMRDRNDHSDVWVVNRKIFLNTYTILS